MRSLFALVLFSSLAPAQSAGPAFDVASIKAAQPLTPDRINTIRLGLTGGPGSDDPLHMTWSYASLRQVLLQAYDVKTYQLTGPAWLDTERFDFAVTVPEGATKEQVRVMWQNLLAERFALKVHKESREFAVDELVVGRNGHKLKETTMDPTLKAEGPPKFTGGEAVLERPGMVTMVTLKGNSPSAQLVAAAQPVSALANMLSSQLSHPVVDKTGLMGFYDFRVEFHPDLKGITLNDGPVGGGPANDVPSDPGMDLAAAVQQQLGLRLEKGKGNVEVVMVDAGNKVPTEN